MWEPQRLTTLWASTACYKDSFLAFTFLATEDIQLDTEILIMFNNMIPELQVRENVEE
jgi:hypothetical protein